MKCLVIPTDSEPDEEPGPMIIPPQAPIEQKKKIKRTRTPSPIPTPQGSYIKNNFQHFSLTVVLYFYFLLYLIIKK